MCGLKILHPQGPKVLLRGQNRTVPQDAPEEFQISTPPEILAGERVTAGMRRHADPGYTQLCAECFEFSQEIPDGDLRIVPRSKEKPGVSARRPPSPPPPKYLAQLHGKWHKTMLSALPMYLNGEVVQIYVFFRKGERLGNPQSGIEKKAHKRVKPSLTRECGFIGHHAPDCRRRKRRQNLLFLFKLRNDDEIFPVLFVKPSEIGIDAPQ